MNLFGFSPFREKREFKLARIGDRANFFINNVHLGSQTIVNPPLLHRVTFELSYSPCPQVSPAPGLPFAPVYIESIVITAGHCYANCDGSLSAPLLDIDDFICFINEFTQAMSLPHEQQVAHYANCDGSTAQPILNIFDFICFIDAFTQGCP